MTSEAAKTRLLVLGAGPGGYPAAFLGAELGMDVTLVDSAENPGGVCLYRGCIPSKTLLHVAHLLEGAEAAEHFGITFGEPEIDLDRLRDWKDEVVRKMTGGLGQLGRARKVNYVQGRGRFVDAHTLRVANDSELTEVSFDYAVVATGSLPAVPGPLRLESERVWDSTAALEIPEVPDRLLVVGGGYIGLELGGVYAALGSQVTVVEMTSTLLPGADPDLVAILEKRVREQMAEVLLHTTVVGLEEAGEAIRATLSSAETETEVREFDRVLIAVGRRPNSADLGLEGVGVTVNERGFIETDVQRRTAAPNIFAIGDVAGEPMLAHKATHEARTAVEAIAGQPSAFDPVAIPAVVFTDPEIAWTGLTETDAQTRGCGRRGGAVPVERLGACDDDRPKRRRDEADPGAGHDAGAGGGDRGNRGGRADRGGDAGGGDGRAGGRPAADDPRAPDAVGDADGSSGAVLQHEPALRRPAVALAGSPRSSRPRRRRRRRGWRDLALIEGERDRFEFDDGTAGLVGPDADEAGSEIASIVKVDGGRGTSIVDRLALAEQFEADGQGADAGHDGVAAGVGDLGDGGGDRTSLGGVRGFGGEAEHDRCVVGLADERCGRQRAEAFEEGLVECPSGLGLRSARGGGASRADEAVIIDGLVELAGAGAVDKDELVEEPELERLLDVHGGLGRVADGD